MTGHPGRRVTRLGAAPGLLAGLLLGRFLLGRHGYPPSFGAWVFGYWYACQAQIARDRTGNPTRPGDRGDPTAWEEFEGLKSSLEKLDRKKKGKTLAGAELAAATRPPDVAAFLDDECKVKV